MQKHTTSPANSQPYRQASEGAESRHSGPGPCPACGHRPPRPRRSLWGTERRLDLVRSLYGHAARDGSLRQFATAVAREASEIVRKLPAATSAVRAATAVARDYVQRQRQLRLHGAVESAPADDRPPAPSPSPYSIVKGWRRSMKAVWTRRWQADAPRCATLVFLALVDRARPARIEDPSCIPSVETIAKDAGVSRATATRGLTWLKESGAIYREARGRKPGTFGVDPEKGAPGRTSSRTWFNEAFIRGQSGLPMVESKTEFAHPSPSENEQESKSPETPDGTDTCEPDGSTKHIRRGNEEWICTNPLPMSDIVDAREPAPLPSGSCPSEPAPPPDARLPAGQERNGSPSASPCHRAGSGKPRPVVDEGENPPAPAPTVPIHPLKRPWKRPTVRRTGIPDGRASFTLARLAFGRPRPPSAAAPPSSAGAPGPGTPVASTPLVAPRCAVRREISTASGG